MGDGERGCCVVVLFVVVLLLHECLSERAMGGFLRLVAQLNC